MPLVYAELRRMASGRMSGERPGHTLRPTELVHEAYLRLAKQGKLKLFNRSHFFAIAATTMRRILVEHARAHTASKRGAGQRKTPLIEAADLSIERTSQLVALDDSLSALAKTDPMKALIAELRFFAGLSLDDTAEVLGCSRPTVVRHWRITKAWLFNELVEERAR